ncbi:MAG: hypothetical protein ACRDHM_05185 [Actinomycetota bacterium]
MKRILLATVAALVLLPATARAETPDYSAKVEAGTTYNWNGSEATGLNVNYWGMFAGVHPVAPGTCSDDRDSYCDTVLLEFSNPLTQAEIDAGKTSKKKNATITISNYGPVPDPGTDFDLILFTSDAQGTKGDELGQSAVWGYDDGDGTESVTTSITTTLAQPSKFVLAEVVYFIVGNSSYDGTAAF